MYAALLVPTGIVARAIEALPLPGDKGGSRLVWQVVITASHLHTTNQQFSNHTYRQFVEILIDDALLHIQQRTAHGDTFLVRQFMAVALYSRFRRPVAVEDMGIWCLFLQTVHQAIREFLTATHHNQTTAQGFHETIASHERYQTRLCRADNIYLIIVHQAGHLDRIIHIVIMNKYEGQSVEESQAMFYERTVEG